MKVGNKNEKKVHSLLFKKSEEIGDYDDELTNNIKIKAIDRKDFSLTYEKAKKILSNMNIKSKQQYYNVCDSDLRFSKEPWEVYSKKFKNWVDYLDIKGDYYDL